jgi:hypothetical protein
LVTPGYVKLLLVLTTTSTSSTYIRVPTSRVTLRYLEKIPIQKTEAIFMNALTLGQRSILLQTALWAVQMFGLPKRQYPGSKKQCSSTSASKNIHSGTRSTYKIIISREVIELGLRLFPAFALALNLPEDFFADKVRNTYAQKKQATHEIPTIGQDCGRNYAYIALSTSNRSGWRTGTRNWSTHRVYSL